MFYINHVGFLLVVLATRTLYAQLGKYQHVSVIITSIPIFTFKHTVLHTHNSTIRAVCLGRRGSSLLLARVSWCRGFKSTYGAFKDSV